MRGFACIFLLLHSISAFADVYVYREGSDGLWLTDAPRSEREASLLYRAADHGRRASAQLDAQCLSRLSSAARDERAGRRGTNVNAQVHAESVGSEVNAAILAAADKSNIDADLLRAVIWVESRCNYRALSSKGARGLMQLMPKTARLYGVTDVFDARENVLAGARYLRDLLGLFSGNVELALAAYNAGPRAIVAAGMRIPPFRETQAYVPAILARVQQLKSL